MISSCFAAIGQPAQTPSAKAKILQVRSIDALQVWLFTSLLPLHAVQLPAKWYYEVLTINSNKALRENEIIQI